MPRCPLFWPRLILKQTLGLKPCRFGSGSCNGMHPKAGSTSLQGSLWMLVWARWLASLWKGLGDSEFSVLLYLPYEMSPIVCVQQSHLHQKIPFFSCCKGRQDMLAAIWTQSSKSQDQPVPPAFSRVTRQQSQV